MRDKKAIDVGHLEQRISELSNAVEDLKQRLAARYVSPVVQCQEELGLYEALFDILVSKGIVTQEEIAAYLDQYKQIWATLINILVDKGITTPKEINCGILAFHHFFRMQGYYSGKSPEEIFEARQKYMKELMELPDPTVMIGN